RSGTHRWAWRYRLVVRLERAVWGRRRGKQAARADHLLLWRAAPRCRRQLDRLRQVELDLELAAAGAGEFVEEALPGLDFHRPGVGHRDIEALALEHRDRFGIDRELLPHGSAGAGGIAAIHRDGVVAAVLMAVVVLEPQALAGAGQHPGARVIVADVERYAQFACGRLAAAHVHHQALAFECVRLGRRRLVGNDASFE